MTQEEKKQLDKILKNTIVFNDFNDIEINQNWEVRHEEIVTVTAIRQVLFFTKLAYSWC